MRDGGLTGGEDASRSSAADNSPSPGLPAVASAWRGERDHRELSIENWLFAIWVRREADRPADVKAGLRADQGAAGLLVGAGLEEESSPATHLSIAAAASLSAYSFGWA